MMVKFAYKGTHLISSQEAKNGADTANKDQTSAVSARAAAAFCLPLHKQTYTEAIDPLQGSETTVRCLLARLIA